MHPKSIRQERQAIRAARNDRLTRQLHLPSFSRTYIYIHHFLAFHFPSPTLRFSSSVAIGTPPPPAGIALQRKSSSSFFFLPWAWLLLQPQRRGFHVRISDPRRHKKPNISSSPCSLFNLQFIIAKSISMLQQSMMFGHLRSGFQSIWFVRSEDGRGTKSYKSSGRWRGGK